MADVIKQSGNIGRVLPMSRSRDSGRRKRPNLPQKPRDEARKGPRQGGDDGHKVDEYV